MAFVSGLELSSFAQVLPSGNVMPSLPFHVPVTSFGPPLGEKSTFMDCPSLANVAASAHSLTSSPALHAPSEPAPSAPVTLPAVTETVRVERVGVPPLQRRRGQGRPGGGRQHRRGRHAAR